MSADKELITATLGRSPLLSKLQSTNLEKVASTVRLQRVETGAVIVESGAPSDAFYMIAEGEVSIFASTTSTPYELCRIGTPESFGELGLLLENTRSATVRAATDCTLLVFDAPVFKQLYQKVPDFGLTICRNLAERLQHTSGLVKHPGFGSDAKLPPVQIMTLLPVPFMTRHRVLPLKTKGKNVTLGCVDKPSSAVLQIVSQAIPGMEVGCVLIPAALFDRAMKSLSGAQAISKKEGAEVNSDTLDQLLRRMVQEGSSDLHLSAGHRPRWRLDGEIIELADSGVLEGDAVLEMIRPQMRDELISEFGLSNDCDFAHAIEGVARFRVNLFRDRLGVGAVFRQIPNTILSIDQLGLPAIIGKLCDQPKGLVLVTGPTGSGKSTTLAAMIDKINRERSAHILTLEDPIEFVHQSRKSLVNQREVGVHTGSFGRALKAALREDPDIILVGEMRDVETVALALETANTGHLVFGTLHTSNAVGTIDRIVDLFPAGQQGQIRSGLADSLRAVVSQTLCRKKGGGRIAAIELLVGTHAVANLIREGKTHQIANVMTTSRADGNQLLNNELKRLVDANQVTKEEALAKAVDKKELAKLLGVKF